MKGVPCEGLGAPYIRDHPVALGWMLNANTWMQNRPQQVLNLCIPHRWEKEEGTREKMPVSAASQSARGVSHPNHSHNWSLRVWQAYRIVPYLPFCPHFPFCTAAMVKKGRLVLDLHMWHDLQLEPEAVGTCFRKLIYFSKMQLLSSAWRLGLLWSVSHL